MGVYVCVFEGYILLVSFNFQKFISSTKPFVHNALALNSSSDMQLTTQLTIWLCLREQNIFAGSDSLSRWQISEFFHKNSEHPLLVYLQVPMLPTGQVWTARLAISQELIGLCGDWALFTHLFLRKHGLLGIANRLLLVYPQLTMVGRPKELLLAECQLPVADHLIQASLSLYLEFAVVKLGHSVIEP